VVLAGLLPFLPTAGYLLIERVIEYASFVPAALLFVAAHPARVSLE
jgi:hypothetical protein